MPNQLWRMDLKAFETKIMFLWIIPIYKYSKWSLEDGCEVFWWKLFTPTDNNNKKYF